MVLIAAVDENMGLMFNGRRQSRDVKLIDKIAEIIKDKKLFMNEYSYGLFKNNEFSNLTVSENFLEEAKNGDFVFLENENIFPYEDKIEKIFLFKWNRVYPSDFSFDININKYKLQKIENFEGKSHEKITMEVYER